MPPADLLKLLAFICLLSVSISAQNFGDKHAQILRAMETRDYQAAAAELTALEKAEPKIFTVNNYDYLAARVAEKQGDTAAAMEYFQKTVSHNSILGEYALWHLSQIARSSGNLALERIYLQKLILIAPESLLINAANKRLARSFYESENFDAAIRILNGQRSEFGSTTNFAGRKTGEDSSREDALLLGRAYLMSDQISSARTVFNKLIGESPNPAQPDDYALEAAKNLDRLDSEKPFETAARIAETEHLRRAAIYQFNRDFPSARMHFQAIAERFGGSANVAYALYQIGRTYAQQADYSRAIEYFERVRTEFPDSQIARDALTQAASAFARVNKPKEAISRYQKFIDDYPDADNLERAYLNIVDVLRDNGEDYEALRWTAKTRADFRGKLPESIALFAAARIHISQNDWARALADLNELLTQPDLGGVRVPGGTNKAEITFLKGFVLEKLGKFSEAIDVFLSIPDGRNEYYGWLATERLKALANGENSKVFARRKFENLQYLTKQNISANNAETVRQAAQSAIRLLSDAENADESLSANMTKKEILSSILRQTYALLPKYQKIPSGKTLEFGRKQVLNEKRDFSNENHHKVLADELLFLGLYDEGTPELEFSLTENDSKGKINPADLSYTLAVFYKRGDLANRAVAYAEPLWKNVPADYQLELIPRAQIELLYPAPYADALLKYAAPRGVDPRFALSIMRQESRFRADVKSNAAARGLMQFISTTADKTASELNRANFHQNDLYHPPTAILFGSEYLSKLFKRFPNQTAAVTGSYNGGDDNIARWLARSNSAEPERYVPEILFPQSKDYIYKVLANYRVYQMFYEENLNAKQPKDVY